MRSKNGFTLVETLIGITLMGFVVVTVLAAFSQIQLNTRTVGDRNIAVVLGESKMEELLKFRGSDLTASTTVDYAVKTGDSFYVKSSDPEKKDQFKRTTVLTKAGNLTDIRVTVEYGRTGNKTGKYFFRVDFNSQKGG